MSRSTETGGRTHGDNHRWRHGWDQCGLDVAAKRGRRIVEHAHALQRERHFSPPVHVAELPPMQGGQLWAAAMSVRARGGPDRSGISARILIAGSDLLAGALANALQNFGFSTMHLRPSTREIERGIEWEPDLVLMDVRSFEVTAGSALIGRLRRASLRVCVMDVADDDCRSTAWLRAGASALVDENEPFDQLFPTIARLLRIDSPPQTRRRSSASLTSTAADEHRDSPLDLSAILTEREQVVLAELMEGHNAEEIARAGYVSISTVRSQIKAILQKLGVNSQLAAVAIARRAGWSLDSPTENTLKPSSSRRRRIS